MASLGRTERSRFSWEAWTASAWEQSSRSATSPGHLHHSAGATPKVSHDLPPGISSVNATGTLQSTGLVLATGKRTGREERAVLTSPVFLLFHLWICRVGSVVPRHLLNHRSPLPVMVVAGKIHKQKDSNSICRTSPEPHIPENFGAMEGRSRFRVLGGVGHVLSAWSCATEMSSGTGNAVQPFLSAWASAGVWDASRDLVLSWNLLPSPLLSSPQQIQKWGRVMVSFSLSFLPN